MAVFGIIGSLSSFEGTLTFIGFLIFLVILEGTFDTLERAAENRDMKALFEKLEKELMMMGIISFAVFIFETAKPGSKDGALFLSFEMTHLIVLFMALAFIFQAVFLVSYASVSGKRYLAAMRAASSDLLMQYKKLKVTKKTEWWFHHGPSLLPAIPSFRTDIEFRIIERLFIYQHKLSHDFNFAHYVNALFKVYTAELGEVSAFSWFLLACLVALNYLRLAVIDPLARGPNCESVPKSYINSIESADSGSSVDARMLAGEGASDACNTYVLIYAYIAMGALSGMAMTVYLAATTYVDRIIAKSLAVDKIVCRYRHGYENSLILMIRKDKMLSHGIADSPRKELMSLVPEKIKLKPTNSRTGPGEWTPQTLSPSDSESAMRTIRFPFSFLSRMAADHQVTAAPMGADEDASNMSGIFFMKCPELFFKAVEAVLLFQCFAIAIVCTQLLPLVVISNHTAGWTIGFIIPVAVNFYIIQMILNKAVLLRAVHSLERDVAGKICEDAVEERGAIAHLRAVVNDKLVEECIPEDERKSFLHNFFFQHDTRGTGIVSKVDFHRILGELSIYMSKESFQLLWQAVDFDLSGGLDWKEIEELFYPRSKPEDEEEKSDLPALRDLRAALHKMLASADIPVYNWETYLHDAFNNFDTDKSLSIDIVEFEAMLSSLNVQVTSQVLMDVFNTIDICRDRSICYEDFFAFLFPEIV